MSRPADKHGAKLDSDPGLVDLDFPRGSRRALGLGAKAKQWQAVITLYAAANEAGTYYAFVDAPDLTSHGRGFAGEPR